MRKRPRSTYRSSDISVNGLLFSWASKKPENTAILGVDGRSLTYRGLYEQAEYTVDRLNSLGFGRNDRVIIVLPNGPEMATAFLSIACGATCAPLNPSYKESEFDFYLRDLDARALMIRSGMDSPAIEVAENLGVEIIWLKPNEGAGAGTFTLTGNGGRSPEEDGFAQPDDTALVLHTSGTTSRPKIVPLTHTNIVTSANSIKDALRLTEKDLCLNIMPLFHIHGLVGALLSSIAAGAGVVCTSGFYAPRFYEWMRTFQPTWYSSVPTMHQAILARAADHNDVVDRNRLRFIRSSSAALPRQVMIELERVFKVPVIESYGMTEASHQMASNPLPPMMRKPGTVGLPAGPEIAIMEEGGNLLPGGVRGEIVIKGPNVTKGYEDNPEANRVAFTGGWFRTGDEGYFDEDGYLVITDRIKEIINRGGEKISPREIDEILLDHPCIAQAVTFAFPHPTLGEEVAAAVVLREDKTATEWEIQEFVSKRLADFKVPRRVLVLDEIPKGPTGKMQRIGLAEKLSLPEFGKKIPVKKREYKPPDTETEKTIAEIWAQVFEIEKIGVEENYFQLGGDSILAGRILARMSETLRTPQLPLVVFLRAPTVEEMADLIDKKQFDMPQASLIAIQQNGGKPPLYFVHACEGEVLFFTTLAELLGSGRPFYALRAQGLDGKKPPYARVEDMAAHYVKEILSKNPEGPYLLGGAGVGGIIAYEMAQRLTSEGKKVPALMMVDPIVPRTCRENLGQPQNPVNHLLARLSFYLGRKELIKLTRTILESKYRGFAAKFNPKHRVWEKTQEATDNYTPQTYKGSLILILPQKRLGYSDDPLERTGLWRKLAAGPFKSKVIPGEHLDVFKEPNVQVLAQEIKRHLNEMGG